MVEEVAVAAGTMSVVERVETAGGRATFTLQGEIDLFNAGELRRALEGCLAEGCCHIAVDMARVGFIDSTGIAALMRAKRSLPHSGDLTVMNASTLVRRALTIRGIDRVITVAASPDELT